jgi:hypothetical protein
MTDSKPVVGTWLSRGILTGLVLLFLYLASLGPAVWLINYCPMAWRPSIEMIYTPVFILSKSELLPNWLIDTYFVWVEWWGDV